MHELSLCQALLGEVERVAAAHAARRVTRVVVRLGPLAGVEPALLRQAWPLAAGEGIAAGAELALEEQPLRVRCRSCGAEGEATINRMLCPACGDWHTTLLSGDELLLASVELEAG